jgi:protein CpxP
MKSLKNKFFIGLTAIALSATSSVYAQSKTEQKPAVAQQHGMDHAKMQEKMMARMKQGMEKHRTQMHDKLKITADQEPAWKTFTEAMMPNNMSHGMSEHKAGMDKMAMSTMTTPVRMEKMVEKAKERLARMQQHLDALKTFYVVLTPEQQKVFDESHRHKRGGMHGKMHMMQRMHMMHKM